MNATTLFPDEELPMRAAGRAKHVSHRVEPFPLSRSRREVRGG